MTRREVDDCSAAAARLPGGRYRVLPAGSPRALRSAIFVITARAHDDRTISCSRRPAGTRGCAGVRCVGSIRPTRGCEQPDMLHNDGSRRYDEALHVRFRIDHGSGTVFAQRHAPATKHSDWNRDGLRSPRSACTRATGCTSIIPTARVGRAIRGAGVRSPRVASRITEPASTTCARTMRSGRRGSSRFSDADIRAIVSKGAVLDPRATDY